MTQNSIPANAPNPAPHVNPASIAVGLNELIYRRVFTAVQINHVASHHRGWWIIPDETHQPPHANTSGRKRVCVPPQELQHSWCESIGLRHFLTDLQQWSLPCKKSVFMSVPPISAPHTVSATRLCLLTLNIFLQVEMKSSGMSPAVALCAQMEKSRRSFFSSSWNMDG